MKTKFIAIVLVCILVIVSIFAFNHKPDIHTATYDNLVQIDGIGDTLANRVLSYLELNKTATIDDLVDVRGIGEVKLRKIRGKYD